MNQLDDLVMEVSDTTDVDEETTRRVVMAYIDCAKGQYPELQETFENLRTVARNSIVNEDGSLTIPKDHTLALVKVYNQFYLAGPFLVDLVRRGKAALA